MYTFVKDKLKKYPIIIGVLGIGLLMGYIFIILLNERHNTIDTTIVSEKLARPQTVEGFEDPRDATRYLLEAMIREDEDMALRVFPIDEKCLYMNPLELLISNDNNLLDTILLPSSLYGNYFPVCSAEITAEYMENLTQYENVFSNWNDVVIKEICYPQPDAQISNQAKIEWEKINTEWGSDASCEVMALLEKDGKEFVTAFTLSNYDGYWKVFSFNSEFAGISDTNLVEEISADGFNNLKKNGKQNTIKNYWSEEVKEVEVDKIDFDDEELLLSPNYFLTNKAFAENPEMLIKDFTKYIQKEETDTALCYFYGEENDENQMSISSKLAEQRNAAYQIKYLYSSILLGSDVRNEGSIEAFGKSKRYILDTLNPEFIPYLTLDDVKKTAKDDIYEAFYVYELDTFKVKFEVIKNKSGWQIKSINSITKMKEKQK